MDNINNVVKQKIMRRVYAIWVFRKLTGPLAIKASALVFLSFFVSRYVSLFDVAKNAFVSSQSPYSLPAYFVKSFIASDIISQALSLGLVFAILVFGGEVFKKKETCLFEAPR